MGDTLVLNRSYYAIHVASWQKAISLLYAGQARAVDDNLQAYDFEDWCELSKLMKSDGHFVHTATLRIAVPEVVQLTAYDRLPRQEVKFSRQNIFAHYNYTCAYCGKKFPKPSKNQKPELNLDHVRPKSKGGLTNWGNIALSCIPCNLKKDDKSLEEAGMELLVKLGRPKWKGPSGLIIGKSNVPPSWERLIDSKYWTSELEK